MPTGAVQAFNRRQLEEQLTHERLSRMEPTQRARELTLRENRKQAMYDKRQARKTSRAVITSNTPSEAMRQHTEELHRRKKMALETLIDEIQPLDLERFINKLTSREHLRSYNTAKYAVEYHPPLPIVYCDHLNHLLIGYKKLKSEHADFQREMDELMSEHEALQSEHEALQRENAELKFI